jgi:putative transposase
MPSGLTRFHQSEQSHFITFTCYHRLPNLKDEKLRDVLVTAFEQTRLQYQFRVYGFVIMPEHVHLLISEPERGTVANVIQSLKISSAMRSTGLRDGDEQHRPLWQKRYYDRNVRDYDEFVEKLRYIHRNPVKRGLAAEPGNWQWSSFRHYLTGEDGGVEIESRWTANKRNAGGELTPHIKG